MARGVTPRPRPGALQKIPFTWQSNSDREAAHILAHHNQWTSRRAQAPVSNASLPTSPALAGGKVSSRMNIRGGAFGPGVKSANTI
jgi:hypothetical protein